MSVCTNSVQVNTITKPLDETMMFRDAIMPSDEVSACMQHDNFETEVDDANRMAREHGFDMPEAAQVYVAALRMKSHSRGNQRFTACPKAFCQGRVHEEGTCCICNGNHDTTACWLLPQNAVPKKVVTRIKAIEAAIA